MNIYQVKKYLKDKVGLKCSIKYNLGRNKFDIYNGTIDKLYKNIFTLKEENGFTKSFSYNDYIMHQIKIDFN